MDDLVAKAAILHEALPYIRRFQQRIFVVKYGGHAMEDDALKESFARDVCLLRYVGIRVVVVHGGGPQITSMLSRLGIQSNFSAGLRITDDETMSVVEMVLGGRINQEVVGLICRHGGRAVGLSGKDDEFMRARRLSEVSAQVKGVAQTVDLGRVGEITQVRCTLLQELMEKGFIPVVASIAVGEDGLALNVNADTAAGKIAAALSAAKLVFMTDVEGVRDADGKLVSSLRARDAEHLITAGVVGEGMIPKLHSALEAVDDGVEKVHIIDGRRRHALLLEIFTDRGVGTEIQRARAREAESRE
ncbi:MAG TPA: acetylglutamate kinase [Polyangiaceae bacterium]|jgi:acetylglutamate kinase